MLARKTLRTALLAVLCLGSLALGDEPKLVVNPDSLFFRQVGSLVPPSQQVLVSAEGGALGSFTAVAGVSSPAGGNWLSVAPTSGIGPTALTVAVNTTNLPPGEFSGSITVTAPGLSDSPRKVKVQLMVLPVGVGVFIVRPDELEFEAVEGGPAPPPRQVQIFNTLTANFTWTAAASVFTPAGGKWLTVSPTSGVGNGVLQVSVDPTGLSKGEYKGQITLTSGNSTAKVEVELEVEGARASRLVIDPRAFNFIVEPHASQPPGPKTLRVKNAGSGTLNWTATATVNTPPGAKWLSISPASGAAPGKITVKADATGLAPGMYSGEITVNAGAAGTEEAKVFLRILGPGKPQVKVKPKALKFTFAAGVASPLSRTVEIRSKASGLTFTAQASTAKGGAWLNITPASGIVPGLITASINAGVAATLSPGVYTGNIEVKVPGAAQEVHNVLVTLKIFALNEPARLEIEPGGMAFLARAGGPNPAPKKVKLEPEGVASLSWAAAVSTASGGNWLSASPLSGTATASVPSEVTISASVAGLAPGVYSGTVVFTPAASSGAPPVSLFVALVVTATAGPAQPDSASVSLAGFATVSAEAASGPLVALFTEPANGFVTQVNLPLNVSVTVLDSTGAPVEGVTVVVSSSNIEPDLVLTDVGNGEYTGVFRALSSGPLTLTGSAEAAALAAPRFAVSGDMAPAAERPTLIFQGGGVSAASFAPSPTPLAPGSLMSLFGLRIAATGAAAFSTPLPISLGGVSVRIGGALAPLVVVGPTQINLQVPFTLEGVEADVVVNNNGVLSPPETISLAAAVPALFTFSQNGEGPGAILHAADGSPVTANRPATAGEFISLYATGLGAVQAPVSSGSAASGLNPVTGSVSVSIGGRPAEVQYAGLAPFFVGLYQINVKVPPGVPAGDALVAISVDGTPATGRATVAIR